MSSEAAPEPVVAVIAAAGAGARFGAARPKQYAELAGRTLLERSMRAMLDVPGVDALVVALSAGDARFGAIALGRDPRVTAVPGAATRAGSVAAALGHVCAAHGERAWALMHDAARPLVARADVVHLLERVREAEAAGLAAGGILAARVADTLKREATGGEGPVRIGATVARDGLWGAQTPQLFRAGALHAALEAAIADAGPDPGAGAVTDEASAAERAGLGCLLVEARAPNPKITWPADLDLARALLAVAGGAAAVEEGRGDAACA